VRALLCRSSGAAVDSSWGLLKEVFEKVLEILKEEGLLKGTKVGLDATTLEANAAMRSIRRKIDGKRYRAYLRKLARQAGRQEPPREDLARFDRRRPQKSCSNKEWENPHDPEARIAKMKDGSTHLAYKAEHALDVETGALVAALIHGADKGDTETIWETVAEAGQNLQGVQERCRQEGKLIQELVPDKGHHSNAAVMRKLYRAGTPRALEGLVRAFLHPLLELFSASTAASEWYRPPVLPLAA